MNTPTTFGPVSPETIPIRARNSKPGEARARRILLLDDDQAVVNLLAAVLAQAGYTVDIATDSEVGWNTLRAGSYDLLIVDNDLPRSTGIEIVARAREAGMTLPVVMASGSSVLEAIQRSGWLDLRAYLRKPFAIHELVDVASRAVTPGNPQGSVAERTGSQP